MQCKNCGTNLVRGFSFCLECGLPVPPEMLEESGLPQRNIDTGPDEAYAPNNTAAASAAPAASEEEQGDLKPQLQGGGEEDRGAALKPQLQGGDTGTGGKALKPKLVGVDTGASGRDLKAGYIGGGDDERGTGERVRAVLQDSSSAEGDSTTEKLVFCPNCGMRMQHNPNICDVCGMLLGNKPSNVPTASNGMPLFNTDGDPFAAANALGGGFGGLSGTFGGTNVNNDPMFNNSSPADDLARLTEQLARFSAAAGMQTIGATENTRVRQLEPEKGQDLKMSDFSMIDDLSSESVPMTDNGVPVIGDNLMDDDPNYHVNIDPYAFVNTSMDEDAVRAPAYGERIKIETAPQSAPPILTAPPASITQPPAHAPESVSPAPADIEPQPVHMTEPSDNAADTAAVTNTAESVPEASEPKAVEPAQDAPEERTAEQTPPDTEQPEKAEKPEQPQETSTAKAAAPTAQATKKCYACGRSMPISDKFCPNCGRSTFGAPSANSANDEPPRASKAKAPAALIVVIVILALAVAGLSFMLFGGAEAIFGGAAQLSINDVQLTMYN